MKQFFAVIILLTASITILSSCGSSHKGTGCNAYGQVDMVDEDRAQR